jgi:phosphoribosylglycinamide formyltransferase-1
MTNEERAEQLWMQYGSDFDRIPKQQIIDLICGELASAQPKNSEYIRLLCGYLFCLGDSSDAALLEKVKYRFDMDSGCMIDGEWIESLKQDDVHSIIRQDLIQRFTEYYQHYYAPPAPKAKNFWQRIFHRKQKT